MKAHPFLAGYLVLLAASWLTETVRAPPGADAALSSVSVARVGEDGGDPVRIAYRDFGEPEPGAPVVVLLHGSPGGIADFDALAAPLRDRFRLLVPDLPGFGASSREIPDYSVEAHGRYVLALLDALGVEEAHWVGFSMGGGVALSAARRQPQRFRSLVLLSSIGVVEHELLGDHDLNHLVHALQLFFLRALDWCVPHFGWLDRFPLNPYYARNFYDSDQRPLRAALVAFEAPALILHGKSDSLVPFAAALEHRRLLPQSELVGFPEGHFLLWQRSASIADLLEDFWSRVDRDTAPRRVDAAPDRRAAALDPFEHSSQPRGPVAWFAFALLVLAASLVSEDLACIGVGFLVARGQVELGAGVSACVFALWVGDFLLYLFGRFGARWIPAAKHTRLVALRARFAGSGALLVFSSRFLPGSRLPVFVGAGATRYPAGRFAALLLAGALLWAPLLVGASSVFGDAALGYLEGVRQGGVLALLLTATLVLLITRVLVPLLTYRGRRLWRGRLKRWTRWEFWPMWLFYPPVAAYVAWLALRHGGLRTATAVNPAIPGGGLVGESKWGILQRLSDAERFIARTALLPAGTSRIDRLESARIFLEQAELDYPVVLKPDVGERGKGVAIVRDPEALARELDRRAEATLLQEYIPGIEFGVFYARRPGQDIGEIISITEKRMIAVTGDGRRTLERLILDDPRAVCMAGVHLERHRHHLRDVPVAGRRVELTELGTHSRGALFLDGAELASAALADRIEAVSRAFNGFFFGRYDLRCDSVPSFQRGEFRVVELNGLSSESTHIYDPKHSLWHAYRTLFVQWRIAYEIGASNRGRDAAVTPWRELWKLARGAGS